MKYKIELTEDEMDIIKNCLELQIGIYLKSNIIEKNTSKLYDKLTLLSTY